MILLGYSEIRTGSTLLTATLGFDDEQLATTTEHWGQVPAKNVANEVITPLGGLSFNNGDFGGTAVRDKQRAASIDNTRSINVHLPGLRQFIRDYGPDGWRSVRGGRYTEVAMSHPPTGL
jgi:hypothetical protein